MTRARSILNVSLAAAILLGAGPFDARSFGVAFAQSAPAEQAISSQDQQLGPQTEARLLAELAREENTGWRRSERQLRIEWSRSGSAAMDLLLSRGREALREDDIPAAIEHLTALTDHAPDFAQGWVERGVAYYKAGQFGPAMLDLARALALNPNQFEALAGVGTILIETGEKERALQAYRLALAIHPRLTNVRDAIQRLEAELIGVPL